MVAKEEALIARVDHDGVLREAVAVEEVEHAADAFVHRLDGREIVLHVALVLPSRQRFAGERDRLAVARRRHRVGLRREPRGERRPLEIGRRLELEIAPRKIRRHTLLVFVQRVGSRVVGIPERLRLRDPSIGELRSVSCVGFPWPVRRFVMEHQEERLIPRPVLDEVDAQVRDHVGHVPPGVRFLAGRSVEDRIHVRALTGQDLPPIEADGIASEVPLPDHAGVVATRLKELRDCPAGAVEAVEHRHAIQVRVLAGENGGAARRADRVRHEHARQHRSLARDAIEVWCLVHARSVHANRMRGMVVGHDVEDVRSAGRPRLRDDRTEKNGRKELAHPIHQSACGNAPSSTAAGNTRRRLRCARRCRRSGCTDCHSTSTSAAHRTAARSGLAADRSDRSRDRSAHPADVSCRPST